MTVDFGKVAADYAAFRAPFPEELFSRLRAMGAGLRGQSVVGLGTGAGALARAFARAGCRVTGIDVAPALLDEARRLDATAGVEVTYEVRRAEDTGLPGGCWDMVAAAQCWHWFDRARAADEARRLLVGGGALVICHLDYLALPGNVCAATEELILHYNLTWTMAGSLGIHPGWTIDAAEAGFTNIETFSFDQSIVFSREAWRGRMRTCNGVGASLPEQTVAEFDRALDRLLAAKFASEPLAIPHRVWAIVARAPSSPA